MIPQLSNLAVENIPVIAYPTRTYRNMETHIAGYVDGLKAMEQAITHRILTERYAYPIYPSNYGTELAQFVGASFGYVKANIGRVLSDSLLGDDRITEVNILEVKQAGLNTCSVVFNVLTNLDTFNFELGLGEENSLRRVL